MVDVFAPDQVIRLHRLSFQGLGYTTLTGNSPNISHSDI